MIQIDEKEIAAKRTVMRTIHGKLRPVKLQIKDHNMNAPKTTRIEGEAVNEDSASRAERSNEYKFHTSSTVMAAPKKVRLKHKETGSTVGIFDDHKAATLALNAHPKKHLLKIEDAEISANDLLKILVDQREQVSESTETAQPTLAFSAYREIFEGIGKELDEAIEKNRQLLLDKKKTKSDIDLNEGRNGLETLKSEHQHTTELLNKANSPALIRKHRMKLARLRDHARKHYKVDLNENAFDWKKPTDRPDWSDKDKDGDRTEIKPKKAVEAPKKAVGRPAGSYGKYKTAERSEAEKKAIADKVHSNPERKANYADAIAARREFSAMMNASIKKRQAQLSK
jgi:hypothetical protein